MERAWEATLSKMSSDLKQKDLIKKSAINVWMHVLHKYCVEKDIRVVPIYYDVNFYRDYIPLGNEQSIVIRLMQAPIIDTSNISWNQILDIRKDKSFIKRIRDFRLFLTDNYRNQSIDYIRDDLNRKLDRYSDGCKKHGLNMILSSLSKLLDSKSFLGSAALSTLGILYGDPITTSLGIGGITIDIGKISINAYIEHLNFNPSRNNPEIAYLVQLKKLEKQ